MDEDVWVVLHRQHHLFIKGFGVSEHDDRAVSIWTPFLKRARAFPSESAANAVIEEWGLEGIAEPCVICTSDS